jgi:hypothetical protein
MPFFWDMYFQENVKDVQKTYFLDDTGTEGQHLKTARCLALVYVLDIPRRPTKSS